jgi:virginiamycin B lyase
MQDIEAAGATRLHQGGDWMQVAGGSAWTAGDGGLQQLDGTTGAPKAHIAAQVVCTAMDVAFDRLWFADCVAGTVLAVDPATARVARTYTLNGSLAVEEGSVGAGEGAIWVSTTDSSLVRLDPKTGATSVFPLPGPGAGVRAGLGSVWVTMPSTDQVLRVDPKDGKVVAVITAGLGPRFLTIGGDSVWVQNNGDGTVTRISADGVVTDTIAVSMSPVDGGDIAYGGGFVWPRISAALIAKLDGKTGQLLATYGPASGSGSVAAGDDAAWVSAHDVTAVWRLPLR